ncbi:hypothetical protein K439DRAFT_1348982 [Ramaria rubella]|nr:hypothetical protein K439DRAFT_1348982 [Ramaria rubella]
MIPSGLLSRQPKRHVWPHEKLIHMRAYALGHALAPLSNITYLSALNSYLNFCKTHDFPVDPTEDTLSFFTVYMCYHIKPASVNSYLSGIQSQLKVYFPHTRQVRHSRLVAKTLQGCKQIRGSEVKRKRPLKPNNIQLLTLTYRSSHLHDDLLFNYNCTASFLCVTLYIGIVVHMVIFSLATRPINSLKAITLFYRN